MFPFLFYLAIFAVLTTRQHTVVFAEGRPFNGIFWEVKPYIYFDQHQQTLSGIYPTVFLKGLTYCNQSNDDRIITLNVNLKTRKQFYDTIQSNLTESEEGLLSNASVNSVWFPYDIDKLKVGPFMFLNRNLSVLVGVSSQGLAIVFPRLKIWLPYKIVRGVWSCRVILVIAIILSLMFGIALWILERTQNPTFAKAGGPMTGLYWSFVTMTTVGYGDVVPVTFFGRLLSVVWMFIGLMVASVLTATVTDVVTGVSGLEINDQRVAVLRNSHEERLTKEDYFATPVPYDSYEDVIEAVRRNEVYAGVLPSDVAAWMRHEFSNPRNTVPLEIVYELDGFVPFDLLVPKDIFSKSDHFLNCMFTKYKNEVVTSTLEMYRKKLVKNILYYGDITDIFEVLYLKISLSLALCALIMSICVTVYNKLKKRNMVMTREDKREKMTKIFEDISLLMAEYKTLTEHDDKTKEVILP